MIFDALILNARLRQSLVAVRSLGRRGLRVAAVDTIRNAPAFSSRWCDRAFVFSVEDGTEAYLHALKQALARTGARVLIPSHDGTIALLRRHRQRLEPTVNLALASESALSIAVNKERTLQIARDLGIRIPRGALVTKVADVRAAVEEIGLPAVAKPSESWVRRGDDGHWVGPQLVTTVEEATRAVETVTALGGIVLLQQFLTGRREAVSFLYAHGAFHVRFSKNSLCCIPRFVRGSRCMPGSLS